MLSRGRVGCKAVSRVCECGTAALARQFVAASPRRLPPTRAALKGMNTFAAKIPRTKGHHGREGSGNTCKSWPGCPDQPRKPPAKVSVKPPPPSERPPLVAVARIVGGNCTGAPPGLDASAECNRRRSLFGARTSEGRSTGFSSADVGVALLPYLHLPLSLSLSFSLSLSLSLASHSHRPRARRALRQAPRCMGESRLGRQDRRGLRTGPGHQACSVGRRGGGQRGRARRACWVP